ncbi:MAG: response regulator [Azospira sp.]|jgi:CheY-like chemotaxis protein/anti-sigma regulatory factor (Ser/Thr protein kinase)|nr:response regulator [Azospira sp.]
MSAPRLLVIDDEPFNLEIISEYFDGLGYLLDTAGGGEEGWILLNEGGQHYDAIILDRMMPQLDGIALLRRIKADARFIDTPVIMQTAAGDPEQVREGLAAGAHYYLVKPYERDSLISIVRGALADGENRRQLQAALARHGHALQLLTHAGFSLRTVDEASTLASFIACGCPTTDAAALGIAELLINAIEHGNLGIGYEEKALLKREDRWLEEVQHRLELPDNRNKRVLVRLERDDAGLTLRISDEGRGFDWRPYLDFDPARAFDPNGRGIALARMAAFESLNYEGSGNTVVARLKEC